MRAGKLRHRIAVYKPAPQSDSDGYGSSSDRAFDFTTWANWQPLSVKDVLSAKIAGSQTQVRCVIRYREGITTEHRVVKDGAEYAIDGDPLPDPNSGREYLTLMLSKGTER